MKIPLFWLKELFSTDLPIDELARILTNLGIEVEDIENQTLHVALTPNLIHAASLLGVARELAAFCQTQAQLPNCSIAHEGEKNCADFIQVEVKAEDASPRYCGRVVYDVKVGPSPQWLVDKLTAVGVRSLNNVVDVTNYVLFEMGQPLHAFDLDRITRQKIVVRLAKKGEEITTLDGKQYFPTEETLVIADEKSPQALAGIMGAASSEVSEHTKIVFLESAYFDPISIRRSAKRMNIHTEASHRFERGVDPNGVIDALNRAAEMIAKLSHGKVARGLIEKSAKTYPKKQIDIRLKRVNSLLGTHFSVGELESILKQFAAGVKKKSEEAFEVTVETFRTDLKEEIDLIEEVARLYGYNTIHRKKYSPEYHGSHLPHSPHYVFEKAVREALLKGSLQEFLTCNLIAPKDVEWIDSNLIKHRSHVVLLNPSSIDQSVLRPSLLPGLLQVVRYNLHHETQDLAGFEVGRVHFKLKEGYHEPLVASIVLTGKKTPPHWSEKGKAFDFYDLKGMLENLFRSLTLPQVQFVRSDASNFHPGQQARMMIDECEIGIMGQLHPQTLKKADVAQEVFFAELNLEDMLPFVLKDLKMKPLPQYPGSLRDWTISLKNQACSYEDVRVCIEKMDSKLLESVSLLDVYQSGEVGSEVKKLTFRFYYREPLATVELKEVDKEHMRITQEVMQKLQGKISEG